MEMIEVLNIIRWREAKDLYMSGKMDEELVRNNKNRKSTIETTWEEVERVIKNRGKELIMG